MHGHQGMLQYGISFLLDFWRFGLLVYVRVVLLISFLKTQTDDWAIKTLGRCLCVFFSLVVFQRLCSL